MSQHNKLANYLIRLKVNKNPSRRCPTFKISCKTLRQIDNTFKKHWLLGSCTLFLERKWASQMVWWSVVWKMKISKTSKVKDDRSLSIQSRIIIRKASKDLWAFALSILSCSFLFVFEHVLDAFKFARVPGPSRVLRIFRILINVVLFCWRQQPGRRTYRRLVLLKLHKIDSKVQLRVLRNYVAGILVRKKWAILMRDGILRRSAFREQYESFLTRQTSVVRRDFTPLSATFYMPF